jgi:hypothetical protein
VLLPSGELGETQSKSAQEITWTYGFGFVFCEKFPNNFLIFTCDVTGAGVWWQREKVFCEGRDVREALNCSIEIASITEVP